MIISHKITLAATFKQRAYLASAAGTARFVWNWALARWNELYEQGEKPRGAVLKKEFNATKYEKFPWLGEIHRDAHSQPFANLQKAFVAFCKGTAKRPTFKKKGKCRDAFYVANDKLRVDGRRIRLPMVGWVRMREGLRFDGRIMGAVISREADRWFVSLQMDVGDYRRDRTRDGIIGSDLGLTTFATVSTGEKISAPKPIRDALRRLRLRQRSLSRKQKGSANREKQRRKVAGVHLRVKNIRNDFLHKTTTRLCRENQAIGIESLNVKGMLRNHRLARAISDVAWGEFGRQLTYKGPIFGCSVVAHDQWEPSSKRCHQCGWVKTTFALWERVFHCEGCGLVCDRDENASLNLVPSADGKLRLGRLPVAAVAEPGTKPCSLVGTN